MSQPSASEPFGSSLDYGNYEFEKYGYMPPSKPMHNGGWYSGESFALGAPYATVATVADTEPLMTDTIRIGNQVNEAHFHRSGERPGNNYVKRDATYYSRITPKNTTPCLTNSAIQKQNPIKPYDPNSGKF